MPKYCKQCGYVFGEDYNVPKLVQKGKCPTCKSSLFETKEPISYFMGRVEKSMPTWEDVVRNKYLKDIKLDNQLYDYNVFNEQKHHKSELDKLKNVPEQTIEKFVPKCPTCQSTDIKKVSAMSKAGSVALWGLFSQKIKKQWHCNNCGSEW